MPRNANTQKHPVSPAAIQLQPAAVAIAEKPPAPVRPIPESVARRNAEILDAEVLLHRKQDGEPIDPSEEAFLTWLWPNDPDLTAQRTRVAKLRRHQLAAETSEARDTAKSKAAAAVAAIDTEGERLRAEIITAQNRLAELECNAKETASAVERHNSALTGLTDPTLLNVVDRANYERLRREWEQKYGIPTRVLRDHAKTMQIRAGWTADANVEQIGVYSQGSKDPAVAALITIRITDARQSFHGGQDESRDRRFFTVNGPAWRGHTNELRAQAIEAEAEAAELEASGETLKSELDDMLKSLVPN